MKKISVILYTLCSLLFTTSCSGDNPAIIDGEENNEGNNIETVTPEVTNEDILIVYFSRAGENWEVGYVDRGNTAIMADYIQEYTRAATFEIVPEVPYPTDYATMLQVSQQERDTDARPAIKNPLENLEQYSTVFIGSPIWYGGPPMIMQTFYETYPALAEKTIIPFGTHAGSGISSCASLIRRYFPNASLLDSYGVSGSRIRDSKNSVEDWLERINIPKRD